MKTIWVALTEREDDIDQYPIAVGTLDACMDLLEKRMQKWIDKPARKALNWPDPAWLNVSVTKRPSAFILCEQHDSGITYGSVLRVKHL